MENIKTWFSNAKTVHHRIMMNYLRKRGWVVFYLPKKNRVCRDMCWLKLYENNNSEE